MRRKTEDRFSKQVKQELDECGQEIESLKCQLAYAKKREAKLKKAVRVLSDSDDRPQGGKTAPNLRHVEQSIRIAFQGKARLAVEQLQERVTQVLKSQEGLSEQGLALRVKQGIAKLDRDSDGFVLPPTA